MPSLLSVRLIANKSLNGNLGGLLELSAISVVTEVLAPFQGHYLCLPIRVRTQLFLSVSAFSIEFLSIV